MPHARQLTMDERRIILNLHERGDTTDEIADVVGRVRGTVLNVIRNPERQAALPRSGRPAKLSPQDKRNLLRKARTGNYFAGEIVRDLNLNISVPYTRQILHRDPNLLWRKMKKKPDMSENHFAARNQWAYDHVSFTQVEWKKVIWTDEKKFNLDGPDGLSYYWHDQRIQRKILSRRHSSGGSIMIWGCFSGCGVGELCELDGRLTSLKYIDILETHLLPFAYANHGTGFNDFILQQDGASAHRAIATRNWLDAVGVKVMTWPAVSPDLNPIENVWGIMAQEVYKHGRKFRNKDELRQTVHQCWDRLEMNTLDKLNESMRDRCIEVLRKNGRATKY